MLNWWYGSYGCPFFDQEWHRNYDSMGDKPAMVLEKAEQPNIISSF